MALCIFKAFSQYKEMEGPEVETVMVSEDAIDTVKTNNTYR
jgi:hypothetical protein